MNQSIIVYRNPVEQMFWEGFMSSPYTWPFVCAVLAFLVVAWALASVVESRWARPYLPRWRWKYEGHAILTAATLVAVAVFVVMV